MLEQYGDYFYLYILMISLIPAAVLGIFEKKIKYYGLCISLVMVFIVIGHNVNEVVSLLIRGQAVKALQSKQSGILLFIVFIVFELILINVYYRIRKKTENKYIYYLVLFASMMPVILSKISPVTKIGAAGFVGLSYLNFRVIQMVIEIYDGSLNDLSFLKTIYFIIFFPTISSGPIDRYRRFCSDLEKRISRSEYINEYLIPGIEHIIKGILYKFCISALISILWKDNIPKDITLFHAINYMYSYSLYLFFDFAGYSAFAIGTGYILGVKVPENFKKPFLSKDMKEFWNRWHISLSRWFGDYIFSRFVLNSMRKKRFKNRIQASHVGQIITMLIMGFWHGLTPYYILYGLYQGIALVLTDIYQRKSKYYKAHKKEKWFQYVQIVVTFHIACLGLLLFSGYGFNNK